MRAVSALFVLLLLAPVARSAPTWQATGEAVPELAAFDAWMREFMTRHGITGGALAVTRDSRLVLARGYTRTEDPQDLVVQPTTRFRIASLSKGITAAGIMHLVQAGHLDLDARVLDVIDAPTPLDARVQDVTVRQLLQHLGGWNRDLSGDPVFADAVIARTLGVPRPIDTADIVAYVLTRQRLDSAPGATYAYSNFGYLLAARVIEAVSGLPYGEYLQRRVFFPLAVRDVALARTAFSDRRPDEVKYHAPGTGFSVLSDAGAQVPIAYGTFNMENLDGAGGWIASAVDLARYAASLDDPARSPVLGENAVDTLFALPANLDPATYRPGDAYYALGWAVRDFGPTRSTWHSGGLPGTMTMLVRRFDGVSYAVLFNRVGWDLYGELDAGLFGVADRIGDWPAHDLFASLRTPPSGGATHGGLMYDRARNGHGLELRAAGDAHTVLFYSYDANGRPEWFIATGEVHDGQFVAASILRVDYDAERSPPQRPVPGVRGHFVIDFAVGPGEPACDDGVDRSDATSLALFDWAIDGERGQWCIEPLLFGGVAPEPDVNGTWWAGPDDEGWGMTVAVQGDVAFVVLYYYDALGLPRFAIGTAPVAAAGPTEIPMQQVDGYCRSCDPESPPLRIRDNGRIVLDLRRPDQSGGAGNSATVDVRFLGPGGGRWQREAVDLRLLSNPAGSP